MTDKVRYYGIGGTTVKVASEIPFREDSFCPEIEQFRLRAPGQEIVTIDHHFYLPQRSELNPGTLVHCRAPWGIYRNEAGWTYFRYRPPATEEEYYKVIVTDPQHRNSAIYCADTEKFMRGRSDCLSFVHNDQFILARYLMTRQGLILHSSSVLLDGGAFVFVGHSEAGKSTAAGFFGGMGTILSEDRSIVRKSEGRYMAYGTWANARLPNVSSDSARLRAILFLEKASVTEVVPLAAKPERTRLLLECLIRPVVCADWWENALTLVEDIADNVPCYMLRFDLSGDIRDVIGAL